MAKKKAEKGEEAKVEVVTAEQKIVQITTDLAGFEKRKPKIVVIKDEKQLAQANDFLVEIKGRVNRIKAIKTEYLEPLKESVKKMESLFNDPLKSYEEIEAAVKRGMADFRIEQEKIAQAEEARLKKQRDDEEAEAKKNNKPAPIAPIVSVARVQSGMVSKSGAGSSSSTKVVKFTVEDSEAIPKKYKDLVYAEAVKKGILDQILRPIVKVEGMKTDIKGVRVYEDFVISVKA